MRTSARPIDIPDSLKWSNDSGLLSFKSARGELTHQIHPSVQLVEQEGKVWFAAIEGAENGIALAGTTRALVQNIVTGLTTGFEKKLTLFGVGYRAKMTGQTLNLTLGLSHPVEYSVPKGITITTPSQTEVVVSGIEKALVGQVAAEIRAFRLPEPYKGKGIRYADEVIVLKEVNK